MLGLEVRQDIPQWASPVSFEGSCNHANSFDRNSYGTLLGQTYASLYPHKVQRMIIDGVVSSASLLRQVSDSPDKRQADNSQ